MLVKWCVIKKSNIVCLYPTRINWRSFAINWNQENIVWLNSDEKKPPQSHCRWLPCRGNLSLREHWKEEIGGGKQAGTHPWLWGNTEIVQATNASVVVEKYRNSSSVNQQMASAYLSQQRNWSAFTNFKQWFPLDLSQGMKGFSQSDLLSSKSSSMQHARNSLWKRSISGFEGFWRRYWHGICQVLAPEEDVFLGRW